MGPSWLGLRWGVRVQQAPLTVDTVVGQRTLGGLAGDIDNGPWHSPGYHAPGHNLKSQKEISKLDLLQSSGPRGMLTWDTWITALRFTLKDLVVDRQTDVVRGRELEETAPPLPGFPLLRWLTCHMLPW